MIITSWIDGNIVKTSTRFHTAGRYIHLRPTGSTVTRDVERTGFGSFVGQNGIESTRRISDQADHIDAGGIVICPIYADGCKAITTIGAILYFTCSHGDEQRIMG